MYDNEKCAQRAIYYSNEGKCWVPVESFESSDINARHFAKGYPLDKKFMVLLSGSTLNELPTELSRRIIDQLKGSYSLHLVDLLTNEVLFAKGIKGFRPFAACGKG